MQTVSEAFLSLGLEDPSDISETQLILLDVALNKKALWPELALGKSISDARAELFVLLKGISNKADQDQIIANYKALQKFREAKRTLDKEEIFPGQKDLYSTLKNGAEYTSLAKTPPLEEKKNAEPKKPVTGDVTIYCDGGCSPNPGQSGSGVAVYRKGSVAELWYGLYESMGTNNTAELNALYQSLLISERESRLGNRVEIRCDSMYSINCIKTWAIGWEKNGWSKKGGEIKNLEIIQKSYYLYNRLKSKVELSHIKAHAGLEGNELADRMTVHAREQKDESFVQYQEVIDVEVILSMRAG